MTLWKRVTLPLAAALALAGLSACFNVFDPIDNPGGDEQILSAARAAFDKGDLAEARELYSKLGGNETAISEKIFLDLDTCGADIGAFGSALVKGSENANTPGIMLSIMGENMYPAHSATCFATLLAAYKTAQTLTDPNLRGFSSFLAATAIAGEVLANNTGASDGSITKADLFTTPSTCNTGGGCSGCTKADGISASAAVTLSSAPTIDASYGTIQGAITAISSALSDLNISTGPSQNLVNALTLVNPNNDALYSCTLSELGLGR